MVVSVFWNVGDYSCGQAATGGVSARGWGFSIPSGEEYGNYFNLRIGPRWQWRILVPFNASFMASKGKLWHNTDPKATYEIYVLYLYSCNKIIKFVSNPVSKVMNSDYFWPTGCFDNKQHARGSINCRPLSNSNVASSIE